MRINTFNQLVEQGQRHFDADVEITEMIDVEMEDGHNTVLFKLDNATGQLDQLAHVLSHCKTQPSTASMAYLIITERCFADMAPTLDLYRKRIGSKAFRNLDETNLDYFENVGCEGCFSDHDRALHSSIDLRAELAINVLRKLGINIDVAMNYDFLDIKGLFSCIQYAHHPQIKISLPALGKAYSSAELREAIKALHAYHIQLEQAVEHYKLKRRTKSVSSRISKSVKQHSITLRILQGSRWLLAQYVVLAHTIGDEPSIQFTTDSMDMLRTQRLEKWVDAASILSALDKLKLAPAHRTTGYGAAAAGAGLMAASPAAATGATVDTEGAALLTTSTAKYDERVLLQETDEPADEAKHLGAWLGKK
ncbi:MAG: hypothetical protein P1U40_04120 [Coxiellaceae bacterium]|nr:hypothetical protein [Coxiellaceae bacterium]